MFRTTHFQRFSITLVSSLMIAALLVGGLAIQPVEASNRELSLPQASPALSDDEIAGLLFMREEEKLAHDVYVTLAEQWDLPIFTNISRSEQQHTSAVLVLIEQYGLTDPAAGNPVGVFVDQTLQALYDDLVEQGSNSLVDALLVGTIIEETDILDLQARIAQTDHADIARLYTNLLRGSSNHLRAYVKTWERMSGEEFVPQYLDQDSYDAIISDRPGRGRGGRGPRG